MKTYSDPYYLHCITFHFTDYKHQGDILLDDTSCRLALGDSSSVAIVQNQIIVVDNMINFL